MPTLPTTFPRFLLTLPWPTPIGGPVLSVVAVHWLRVARRTYSAQQQVALYADDGGSLGSTVALACHESSFELQSTARFRAIVLEVLRAIAVYHVSILVRAAAPPGAPLPSGTGLCVSPTVGAHWNTGAGLPPSPLGTFAAFRILPAAAYDTTAIQVLPYRYNQGGV
jgi:hypothetical protein